MSNENNISRKRPAGQLPLQPTVKSRSLLKEVKSISEKSRHPDNTNVKDVEIVDIILKPPKVIDVVEVFDDSDDSDDDIFIIEERLSSINDSKILIPDDTNILEGNVIKITDVQDVRDESNHKSINDNQNEVLSQPRTEIVLREIVKSPQNNELGLKIESVFSLKECPIGYAMAEAEQMESQKMAANESCVWTTESPETNSRVQEVCVSNASKDMDKAANCICTQTISDEICEIIKEMDQKGDVSQKYRVVREKLLAILEKIKLHQYMPVEKKDPITMVNQSAGLILEVGTNPKITQEHNRASHVSPSIPVNPEPYKVPEQTWSSPIFTSSEDHPINLQDASQPWFKVYPKIQTSQKNMMEIKCRVCERAATICCKFCWRIAYCSMACALQHWNFGHSKSCNVASRK